MALGSDVIFNSDDIHERMAFLFTLKYGRVAWHAYESDLEKCRARAREEGMPEGSLPVRLKIDRAVIAEFVKREIKSSEEYAGMSEIELERIAVACLLTKDLFRQIVEKSEWWQDRHFAD
ncbi:MAG: hypothetical protein OXN84_01025 [Albidovulum sp.]|nr:hypothetical protein [Albidovulum sp.]